MMKEERCPDCGAERKDQGFHYDGQNCDCGWTFGGSSQMETEQIDKLFLELAQFTNAVTPGMRRLMDAADVATRRAHELEEYLRANCLACLSCGGTGRRRRSPEFKCFDCNGTGLAGHARTSVDDPGPEG